MDINLLSNNAKGREEVERRRLEEEAKRVVMSSPISAPAPREAAPREVIEQLPSPPRRRFWLRRWLGQRVPPVPNAAVPAHPSSTPRVVLAPVVPAASKVEPPPALPSHLKTPAPVATVESAPAKPAVQVLPSPPVPKPLAPPVVSAPVVQVKPPALAQPQALSFKKPEPQKLAPQVPPPPAYARAALMLVALAVAGGAGLALRFVIAADTKQQLHALARQQRQLESELAALQSDEAEGAVLKDRLRALHELLQEHVSLKPLFKTLATTVIPTVQYTGITLRDDKHLDINGFSLTYEDAAKQMEGLRGAAIVSAVQLTTANFDARQRLVNFQLSITLNPQVLQYVAD